MSCHWNCPNCGHINEADELDRGDDPFELGCSCKACGQAVTLWHKPGSVSVIGVIPKEK